jgi:hypothetical protein
MSGRGRPGSSSRRIRWWPIWTAGALALVLSFLVTLWLTKPDKPPIPAAKSMTQSSP